MRLTPGCCQAVSPRGCGATPGAAEQTWTGPLTITDLVSDVRDYSAIAPRTDPAVLAGRLSDHLQEMNEAIVSEGGTALKHVRDAVMAALGSAERLEYTLVGDTVSGSAA